MALVAPLAGARAEHTTWRAPPAAVHGRMPTGLLGSGLWLSLAGEIMTRRAFSFGSRVIRDRLGASCSDASTTALSPNRGAVSIQVCGSMPIAVLGIAVALFSPWRKRWLRSACEGKFFSRELKALRVFRAETRLTVYRPRQFVWLAVEFL